MAEPVPADRPRRLVFGEVAELYDRHRPDYPGALIDDLAAWARAGDTAPRALEVGPGTGKATRLLAARGVAVLGVEPSPAMAAIARRTTVGLGDVVIVESDFERWDPAGQRFPLVYAAQAWHWVDQERGYAHARAAMNDGGRLVAFWNRPAWGDTDVRRALSAAYRRTVPDLTHGPMHPDRDAEDADLEYWPGRVAATEGLGEPERRQYEWSTDYTADDYVELLATMSEIRLLDESRRLGFLREVGRTIDEHGGAFTMPMFVNAEIARAV